MDPKLKALQAKWYAKLKRSGFDDIEAEGRDLLKQWDSFHFREKYAPVEFANKERYFQLANQLLHELEFATKKDKKIWALHADGKTWNEISKEVGYHWRTVAKKVSHYASYIKS